MSDDDPKPCPFCGAVPQAYVAFGGPAVICETCDIEMLLTEWNNRSVQPENDALRAEGFAAGWAAAIEAAAGALHNAANDWRSTGNELPARKIEDEIPLVRAIPMPADIAPLLSAREAQVQWVKPDLSHGWLIYKARRGWYRPSARGYTSHVAEAGRYSREDALSYSHPNGWDGPRDEITVRHESEFPELAADASAALDRRLREARAQGVREAARICATAEQETKLDAIEATIFHLGFTEGRKVCERAILARAAEIEEGRA